MCNCNQCAWQNAARARISSACIGAPLSGERVVSDAWRDYYAARRSEECKCACNNCCECGCCECGRRGCCECCCECGRCGCC